MIDMQFECLDAMLAVFETEPDAEEALIAKIAQTEAPTGLELVGDLAGIV